MRIMVTGGCGFIGSNFIRMVMRDFPDCRVWNVDCLTYAGNLANLKDFENQFKGRYFFERADIADGEAMKRILSDNKIDAVVNFAAESHVDRSINDASAFVRTNVLGAQTLLQAARQVGVERYVHVSTDEVYGTLGKDGAFTEQTPIAPNSPYSASKASADLFCRAWYETYNFPVVITRCSNNYGPYQFPEKLIPFMFTRAMSNQPLPVYGTGENIRDWIHVEDHCRGVWLALTKGRPGAVYNFGGDAERSNMVVVKRILEFCNKPGTLISFVQDRPGHDFRYAMDFSLAAAELGFAPAHSFEDGLRETLEWYAANGEWIAGVTSGEYLTFLEKWYGGKI